MSDFAKIFEDLRALYYAQGKPGMLNMVNDLQAVVDRRAPSAPLEGETPETLRPEDVFVEHGLHVQGMAQRGARVTHLKTGISVSEQSEPTNAKNMNKAKERLARILAALSPASTEKPVALEAAEELDAAWAAVNLIEKDRCDVRVQAKRLDRLEAARKHIKELRAAPASVREGLLPMESSPKDGTWVLLKASESFYDGRYFVGQYQGNARGWSPFPGVGGYPDSRFTGWMPLPSNEQEPRA